MSFYQGGQGNSESHPLTPEYRGIEIGAASVSPFARGVGVAHQLVEERLYCSLLIHDASSLASIMG